MREMSNEEFNSTDWGNSADKKALSEQCEQNLTVIGCTGVEDEL